MMQVNRDTMSFATKLSHLVLREKCLDGTTTLTPRDIMKQPQTDAGKFSLPVRHCSKTLKAPRLA
jgi:nicotinamide phosphoribosyltransferase